LRRLITNLPLMGDYAIGREGHKFKIAFESDLDAKLAKGLVEGIPVYLRLSSMIGSCLSGIAPPPGLNAKRAA